MARKSNPAPTSAFDADQASPTGDAPPTRSCFASGEYPITSSAAVGADDPRPSIVVAAPQRSSRRTASGRAPIVIVADHPDRAQAAAEALRSDGAEYRSRDWDLGLLGGSVEVIGRRANRSDSPPLALGVVDGSLRLHGKAVELSGRPLRFASYLVSRAVERTRDDAPHDRAVEVVTREELARSVWHRNGVSAGSFDQAARAVRIALAPEGRRLQTVKGLGYWIQIM